MLENILPEIKLAVLVVIAIILAILGLRKYQKFCRKNEKK